MFKNIPIDVIKRILFGFSLTFLFSVLGGLFFLNFNFNFWITSSFFFLLQIIGFYFYGEHIKRKNANIAAELELRALAELNKNSADVVCPCDAKVQTRIPIDMSSENSYMCSQCNKKVKVIIDIKTALKTDPISDDPLSNPALLKDVEEALKDPAHNDRI